MPVHQPRPVAPRRLPAQSNKGRRRDPAPRHIEFVPTFAKLANRSPDRHYVWASRSNDAVADYRGMGYEIETHKPDGVRPVSQDNPAMGSEIQHRELTLMSIPMSKYQDIVENGPDGGFGQKHADEIEQHILDIQEGELDPIRGQRGRAYVKFNVDEAESEVL